MPVFEIYQERRSIESRVITVRAMSKEVLERAPELEKLLEKCGNAWEVDDWTYRDQRIGELKHVDPEEIESEYTIGDIGKLRAKENYVDERQQQLPGVLNRSEQG